METILGSFEARKANTWSGDILYSMVVSTERLVGVRVGGQFAVEGGLAAVLVHLGLIGVLINAVMRKSVEKKRLAAREQLEQSSLDELLHRHPKNFELRHASLDRVEIKRVRFTMHGPAVAKLVLDRAGEKQLELQIVSVALLAESVKVLRAALHDRVILDPALALTLEAHDRKSRAA
jgi:hypothetical protein